MYVKKELETNMYGMIPAFILKSYMCKENSLEQGDYYSTLESTFYFQYYGMFQSYYNKHFCNLKICKSGKHKSKELRQNCYCKQNIFKIADLKMTKNLKLLKIYLHSENLKNQNKNVSQQCTNTAEA